MTMWRKATAAGLVLAPITLAVSTGVDPALGDDQGYGIYRQHPQATQWHSLLLHWAWVLYVPALLGLLALVRRRGFALAVVAWVATVLGLVTFSALMAADFGLLSLEQQPGLTEAQLAAYDDRIGAMTWAAWGWQIPGIAGWAVALLVTPLAAARARVITWWTAGLFLAGAALYLLFAISPVPLNLTGPVVLVAAGVLAARSVLTVVPPEDEPDRFGAFRRTGGIVCLIAAPLSFAVGMATVPPSPESDHAGLWQASAFFLHLAWVLFVPAVLAVASRGGRFTRIVSGLAVLGLINFSALMFGDYLDLAARQVLGEAVADRAQELTGGYATFSLGWVLPGMVLTFLGLILVAVGAAVDGLVRWWVPVIVGAGFAGFFLLGLGPIGVAGPLVLVAGFGLIATALRRTGSPVLV